MLPQCSRDPTAELIDGPPLAMPCKKELTVKDHEELLVGESLVKFYWGHATYPILEKVHMSQTRLAAFFPPLLKFLGFDDVMSSVLCFVLF
jgi:hypothetical protein